MGCCGPGAEFTALPPDARADRRGSSARQPHRGRRRAPDRPVGAHDPLRRVHPNGRDGARRAFRRGERARQPFHQARNRPLARRRRPTALCRNAQAGRLRGAFVRHRIGQGGRCAFGTDTRPRRRGLRGEQYHAAVGVDLVGRRRRHPRPVSLVVCDHRPARAGLFRPAIFSFGMASPEPRTHQHGRADLAGRAARLRLEPLRDSASWPARLFRRRDFVAVLSADRTHARPRDA